jgi:hypothetical protein
MLSVNNKTFMQSVIMPSVVAPVKELPPDDQNFNLYWNVVQFSSTGLCQSGATLLGYATHKYWTSLKNLLGTKAPAYFVPPSETEKCFDHWFHFAIKDAFITLHSMLG